MALTGFIKQLLETDSVFSSEAKKFTGINDSANVHTILSANIFQYPEVGFLFDISIREDEIFIFFPVYADADRNLLPRIDIIEPGKLVKFTMSNIENSSQTEYERTPFLVDLTSPEAIEQQRETANRLNGFTVLVERVLYNPGNSNDPPLFGIGCSRIAADGPELVSFLEPFRRIYNLDPIFIIPEANNLTINSISIACSIEGAIVNFTAVSSPNTEPGTFVVGDNARETAENLGKAFEGLTGSSFRAVVKERPDAPGNYGVQIFDAGPSDRFISVEDPVIGLIAFTDENGSPRFNVSDDILDNFGPVDVTFDTRIASTIDNAHIAEIASNGSTMFNLDNNSPRDKIDAGAGIALKYAAHYHGEKDIKVVTNSRDSENNPLFRLESEQDPIIEDTRVAVYNADNAFNYVDNNNTGTDPNIKVVYRNSDKSTTVAQYGNIGQGAVWEITMSAPPVLWELDSEGELIVGGTTFFINGSEDPFLGPIIFPYGFKEENRVGLFWDWPPFEPSTPAESDEVVYRSLESLMNVINSGLLFKFGVNNLFTFELIGEVTDSEVTLVMTSIKNSDINKLDFDTIRGEGILTVPKTKNATNPIPISGNEFITYDDLIARLKEAEAEFNVIIEDITRENTFLFKTTNIGVLLITLVQPIDSSDIFTDTLGNELTIIEIGGLITKATLVDAEPVFDSSGNVVFSNDNPSLLI